MADAVSTSKPAVDQRSGRGRRRAENDESERLHVRIARCGICSRRAAEKLIEEGRVEVNGNIVVEMGVKVGPNDEVRVDGSVLQVARTVVLAFFKPTQVLTTLSDPSRKRTIADFLPDYGFQVKPVGRLDYDSDGLLIVTNDGELANRLMHPRYGVEKEYRVQIHGVLSEKDLEKLRTGIFIEGGKTRPAEVKVVYADPRGESSAVNFVIHEGKKRQIRLMCEAVGHPVTKLRRTRFGPIKLKGMKPGECRLLGKEELLKLRTEVGLKPE